MRFLVLQHISCEPPAVYEDVLREHRTDIHRVELDEQQALPDWRDFNAIIAMGGPMSANDDQELPWLRDEKRLISEADFYGRRFATGVVTPALRAQGFRVTGQTL